MAIRPVLRWAGGKYKLLSQLSTLLPQDWNVYYEPMVGGGALFFFLSPKTSILADVSQELINFYQVLKTQSERFISEIITLRASREKYYQFRNSHPINTFQRAVRFAYLNRLCWNGLYRVNRNGEFNVPIGDRLPQNMWKRQHLAAAAAALQNATLIASDFEESLSTVSKGDFVFLDPPYPRGAISGIGFNRYSPDRFSLEDHKRLSIIIRRLHNKGVMIMLLVSGLHEIHSLYPREFERTVFTQRSLISASGSSRRQVSEMVLRNY